MRITLAPLALSLAVVTGCGDSSGDGSKAATELATALCELAFDCCSRNEVDFFLGPFVIDPENCVDRLVHSANVAEGITFQNAAFPELAIDLPNLFQLRRAIKGGRTRVNREALDSCLDFLAARACNAYLEAEPPPEGCVPPEVAPQSPCRASLIFNGRVGEGGACSSIGQTYECREGHVCRGFSELGVEGACVPLGDVDDFCRLNSECRDGLYCSRLDGTCQVPRAEGESCLYADPEDPAPPASTLLIRCEAGLSCDPVTDTCVAPCRRGASCFMDEQCDEEEGLVCVISRCDLPRPLGLPCGENGDCDEALRCGTDPADPTRLVCLEKLEDGDGCNPFGTGDEDCESGFCDPDILECAPSRDPGEICRFDNECAGGYCEEEVIICSSDEQCLGSGSCDLDMGICLFRCVAPRPDGVECARDEHCESETCVNLVCRTLPLADGEPCTTNLHCESEFCGLDAPRVCESLPLERGQSCTSAVQCASGVCFLGRCDVGLDEGDRCGDFNQPPCARDLYCDFGGEPPECTRFLTTGESCENNAQCRGSCVTRFGRRVCDDTPPIEGAVCEGL